MTTTVRLKRNLVALGLIVSLIFAGLIAFSPSSSGATATATKHYIANVSGVYPYDTSKTNYQVAASLGYNVLDVSSVSLIPTLPTGTQAMFWLGSGQKCPQPIDSGFMTTVDRLIPYESKVYGVYLSDEPQAPSTETTPSYCPDGTKATEQNVLNLKARNDYVKSKLPNVKTFVVIDNQQTFYPYRPAVTGVELVGIDPYPFNVNNAGGSPDYGKIPQRVSWATTGGWAKSSIVPTFQLFGQQCTSGGDKYYRFPTDAELNTLLNTWEANGPFSELDYSYGWKNQLPDTACPTLVDRPSAQQIMKDYFGGSLPSPTTTSTTPAPTTTSTTPVPTTTTSVPTVTTTTVTPTTTTTSPTPTRTKKPKPTRPNS